MKIIHCYTTQLSGVCNTQFSQVYFIDGKCLCVGSKVSYLEELARCRQRVTCKQKELSAVESALSENSRCSTGSTVDIRLALTLSGMWTFILTIIIAQQFISK